MGVQVAADGVGAGFVALDRGDWAAAAELADPSALSGPALAAEGR